MKALLPFDELINYFSNHWQLTDVKTLQNSTHRYVAFAQSELYQATVVLKVYFSSQDFFYERQALEFYQGVGCVRLLNYDADKKALLLQAITPGTSLKSLFPADDNLAIQYAVDVIKKMHTGKELSSVNHYPAIDDWLKLLDNFDDKKIPHELVKKAKKLKNNLLNSQKKIYLLHGDLHHENILLDENNIPIAIDPKGVVGELAYEVGAFVRNPIMELTIQENIIKIILSRVDKFSQLLDIDRQRLIDWSFVQAVLAACWAIEDGFDVEVNFLLCAEILSEHASFQ